MADDVQVHPRTIAGDANGRKRVDSVAIGAGDVDAEMADRRRRVQTDLRELLEAEQSARRDAQRAAERIRRLQEITGQISRSLEPGDVLAAIARSAAELLDAPVGAVFLLDPENPRSDFTLAAAHGIEQRRAPELRLPRHASLAGRAVDQGETIVVDDVREVPGTVLPRLLTGETAGSEIAAPIVSGDESLGVVKAFSPTVRRFSADDAGLLTALASTAAAALTNARLYREAADAIRARDDFISTAAHDLKTPLTAIKFGAQLLRHKARSGNGLAPERLFESLEAINIAATRAARQINILLDVSRVGSEAPLDLQPTDAVALAREIIAEHQSATGHDIGLDAAEDAIVGSWDPSRLERVLDNLIGNAVKYSPNGGRITVSVKREGDEAVIAVSDEGMGIPEADVPRIFDRFSRGSNVSSTVSGVGIGLASVRTIVERHGGTVDVESREGLGSTFTVRLPLGVDTCAAQYQARTSTYSHAKQRRSRISPWSPARASRT